jgi:hypothetical protein
MNEKLTHGDFPVESQRYGTSRYCLPDRRSDAEELQEYKRVLHPKRMEQIIALWKQATGETVQPDLDTLMVWLVKQSQR